MNLPDLIYDAIHNLWIRKLRTVLNLVGIVVSGVLLLTTFSATTGIQEGMQRFFEKSHEAKRFRIVPTFDRSIRVPENAIAIPSGAMSERRQKRIRKLLEDKWKRENVTRPKTLAREKLHRIKNLEFVTDVAPRFQYKGLLEIENQETEDKQLIQTSTKSGQIVSGQSYFDSELKSRVFIGEYLDRKETNGLILHEALAYEMGFQDDADLQSLIGRNISIRFSKSKNTLTDLGTQFYELSLADQETLTSVISQVLAGKPLDSIDPKALLIAQRFASSKDKSNAINRSIKTDSSKYVRCEFVIKGIFRARDEDDPNSYLSRLIGEGRLVVHYSQLQQIAMEMGQFEVRSASVFVDHVKHLESVTEKVKEESVRPLSAVNFVQGLYKTIDKYKYALLAVGLVILLVSAIGISNTMIISLVERTEEIGIMKAIGASNQTVMRLILLEGFMTGLIGGLIAVGFTWLLTRLIDNRLRELVEDRVRIVLEGEVFTIEIWMIVATVAISTLVSMIACYWPAKRASKMDPIKAMGKLS